MNETLADATRVCRPESALRADATARSARSTFFSSASMSISSTAAHASAARASAASASASRSAAISISFSASPAIAVTRATPLRPASRSRPCPNAASIEFSEASPPFDAAR